MKKIKSLKTPFLMAIVMFVLCGLFYPLSMTGIANVFFPQQAKGNLLEVNGVPMGATYVGQSFEDKRFLYSRPSAVGYNIYDALTGESEGPQSGSDNFAPSNPALVERVAEDITDFLEQHPQVDITDIPADLMTASGSGLDPHISPQAARIQVPRIATHTGLKATEIEAIIAKHTTKKWLGIFGEEAVNVLHVNLEIALLIDITG